MRPTIIVVHPKEKRSKCSVEPLRGSEGIVFWKFPQRGEERLDQYVRLGFGGPILSQDDQDSGLLLLDGTWRLAEKMEPDYEEVPVRSLLSWETAYPRVSKLFDDPLAGLATVEALYAALLQMGHPTEGILDHYHWKDRFLQRNASLIEQFRSSSPNA